MLKFLGILIAALVGTGMVAARSSLLAQDTQPAGRAILVLDGSGSMWGQIEGVNKIVIARDVIRDLVLDWDDGLHLGLMVYGHRRKGDCADIELLFEPEAGTAQRVPQAVDAIKPKGKTPLTASVVAAAEQLRYTEESATVILVTDGKETCERDPCSVARSLEDTGVNFTTHVVGFDIAPEDRAGLMCIAEATGGRYFDADNADSLSAALGSAVQETAESLQPNQLFATLAEGLAPSDNPQISWKVFARGDDDAPTGEPVYAGVTAAPFLDVPPGAYLATAQLGVASASAPVDIIEGEPGRFVVNLNAAEIQADYKLSSDQALGDEDVRWDLLGAGSSGQPSQSLAATVDERAVFYAPPGSYSVQALKGKNSAREAVAVEAGQEYEITVNLRLGEVAVDLDLDGKGTKHNPDVSWSLFRPDPEGGDPIWIFTSVGKSAFTYQAPAGKHLISISIQGTYEKSVPVTFVEGQQQDLKINLDAGILRIQTSGPSSQFGFSTFSRREEGGEFVSTGRMLSSNLHYFPYVFAAGEYRLAATGSNGQSVEAEFEIKPGETTNLSIIFPE